MPETTDPRKMNRGWRITPTAILMLAAAVCFLVVPVAAHAPTDMSISFDPSTAKIYVTITHPVDDPATHYLKTVQVKLNGRVISDPDYKSQPAKDTFTLTYDVNANPGDAVRVTAICVQGGTFEKTYSVPQTVRTTTPATPVQTQPPATAPPTTRASAGLLPLLGAAAALLIRKD